MNLKNHIMLVGVVAVPLASPTHAATILGLNFTREYSNTRIQGGTADGFSGWTDSWDLTGDQEFKSRTTAITLGGSTSVAVTWNSSNHFFAGQEDNKEQAIYRSYLDDGDVGDGLGVRVTITGLASWLVAEGMTSYQIRAYSSTDTD